MRYFQAKVLRNDGAMMKDFKPELTAYLTNVYGSSEMYNKTIYTLDSRSEVKMKFTVPIGDKDEYHSVIVSSTLNQILFLLQHKVITFRIELLLFNITLHI